MNVYDEANNLAKALRESDEYKRFKEAETTLKQDNERWKIASDYAKKQMAMQSKQMMGQELTEDEINAYNTLTQTVLGIPVIADYFQSQMYFGMIFQDIMGIISEAVELDPGFFSDEEKSEEETSEGEKPEE
ncbi:MAG: YlbF family regulator [Eubacteriaceae bacterium]|jgi:cell fate (sporulation/competence/biofilm development) regulator YlbF (YheA/YmcA/DUF963 family)